MGDEIPQALQTRINHIGHTDPASALQQQQQQQQDVQLWQHISLSQPQPSTGVQAVPVGIGFSSRPQQQLWPDHTSAFSRGWQPFPQSHTQQSPQESQELAPQVVRSQHQNWPGGDMNPIQLQQLQHLILLQQQQQQHHLQQIQQQQQQQQQHHHLDQGLHHLEPIAQHDDHNQEKFTKSPSPQIEDNRNSPAVGRQFIHNIASPQQQVWPHPQMVHQYDTSLQHGEPQHSQPQAFQPTPVSHHQPLFAQQQYVHQPLWQHHTPFSQVPVQQHLRQSTPPIQQHVLWHQQQQQQLHQHQLQQQQHLHHDSQPPYSPPSSSSSFADKPTSFERKEVDTRTDSLFINNRIHNDALATRNDKIPESIITSVNTMPTISTTNLSMPVTNVTNTPKPPIRILSKSHPDPIDPPVLNQVSKPQEHPTFPSVSIPQPSPVRPIHPAPHPASTSISNQTSPNVSKPLSFNPNLSINHPYQNNVMNNQNIMSKGIHGLYGSQQTTPRFPSPVKERTYGHSNLNQYRPRSPAAVVRNHQPQGVVINNVYQRTTPAQGSNIHHVENVDVYIFVQGLNPRTRSDSIQSFFENIGKPSTVRDKILFNLDHTEALIIYQQRPDMIRLKQNVKTRKLDGFSLEICEVAPPKSIVVSSDVPIRSLDGVKHYFERDSVGGRLKKNGMDETEDGCCLLEFEDYRVVQRICNSSRTHKVDGVYLRVSPYYHCENGAIWDMNLHIVPVPKPVNIQILPDQLEYVKRFCQPLFTSRLRDKFADVSFSKDHVTVKCMLRQSMPNYRSLARSWDSGIQEAVAKFLATNIDQADLGIPENVWDKVCEFLNSGRQELKDLLLKPERERHALKIVGNKNNVKAASNLIQTHTDKLIRAARRKVESRKVKSPEQLSVLKLQGTVNGICDKFTDLLIHIDGNEVTVEGDPTDIPTAFIELYKECEKVEPVTHKHTNSREWVAFMKKDIAKMFIQKKLDVKRLQGCWAVSNTEVLVYVPKDGKSDPIKDIVLKSVVENSLNVEKSSLELLQSEVWVDFLSDLRRRSNDKADIAYMKKSLNVIVVGLDETVPSIVKQIKEFLDSKTVKNVLVQCEHLQIEFINQCWSEEDYTEIQKNDVVVKLKANGIEVSGLADNLIKAKQKLDLKLKRMCSKKHQLRRTGVQSVLRTFYQCGLVDSIESEFKCVVKLPQELQVPPTGYLGDCNLDNAYTKEESLPGANTSSKGFHTRCHRIRVHIVHGDIGHQKADILVASAVSSLNLRSGSTSYSLMKQGGAGLQSECEKLYPNGVQDGEVAVIGSGNLSCDKVYLSSLPSWKDAAANHGKVLRHFMRECLRLADRGGKKTMAFSSLGSGGFLGYPRDVVASLMYGAIVEFDHSYPSTSLRDISIVISGKDTETIKVFEEHEQQRVHGQTTHYGPLSTSFANGCMKIELVTDDLATQKVDAILCSVSTDMNLKRNAICNSLVQHGGKELEAECKQKYKNELKVGEVAEITPGKLECKNVYLTVLPPYTDPSNAEQSLINMMHQVLDLASDKGYTSLTLPAMGTGSLNYPKNIAAKCAYDAIITWATKHTKSSLKLVRFVMYSKDTESQQAYRLCHVQCEGREMRLNRGFVGDGTVLKKDSKDTQHYKMVRDGCVVGPVKLTVNVGDILNTSVDAIVVGVGTNFDMKGELAKKLSTKCPNLIPECQQKKSELKKDGLVTTSGSELPVSKILHVQAPETLAAWRGKIVACLDEANKQKLKSLALPPPTAGSEGKVLNAESIGECLFAAIDDYTSQNKDSTVADVRVVLTKDSETCKPAILSALQSKVTFCCHSTGSKTPTPQVESNTKTSNNKTKDGRMNGKDHRQGSGNRSSTECVHVVVYSDAIINIDRCIKALDDKVSLQYLQRTLKADKDVLKNMNDKEIEKIASSSLSVEAKYDKKASIFTIQGPSISVHQAIDNINNQLRQCQRERESKEAAKELYSNVRWHWLYEDATVTGLVEKPYTELPNFVIESSYKEGKDSLELVDTSGRIYVIDFKKLVDYSKSNGSDCVCIARKDVLKTGQLAVPPSWMSMSNNENLKRVTLTLGKEFSEVEKLFVGQVKNGLYASKQQNRYNLQIQKIERLQNRALYLQYAAKKKQMEQQKTSKKLEQKVWHVTTEEAITSIINNGFNRTYCNNNGVLYGQGVYFAADASYSVQDYVNKRSSCKRYIFLSKALTGDYIKGNPTLRLPPAKNSSNSTTANSSTSNSSSSNSSSSNSTTPNSTTSSALYDSTVDDENNPMEYVIYHDTQVYPDYLITFTI